jgi:ABC-type transport system involved in cytochrome c biogenesis permease component
VLSFPLIARELRAQARKRATYDVRLGAGLMAICIVFLFIWNLPEQSVTGETIFAVIHGNIAVMLFFLAPIGAADAISREKREGTLGLLLLTGLTPTQIVLGKVATHAVRTFYFLLLVLPLSIIPVLLGGVTWQDLLASLAILLAIAAVGLGAALVASALFLNFGAAMAWAILFSALFTVAISSFTINGLFVALKTTRLDEAPLGWRLFGFGTLGMMFPVQSQQIASMFVASRWGFAYFAFSLPLVSFLFLHRTVKFAARKIAQRREFSGETQRETKFRQTFLTPIVWRGAFRRTMSRALDLNPLIWLEYRAAWARAARWLIVLLIFFAEMRFGEGGQFLGPHLMILLLFLAILSFKSSSSFQQEKESGAFELLLVTPLTESNLLGARLKAVANYYAPAVLLLLFFSYVALKFGSDYSDQRELTPAVLLTSLLGSIVSVPVCGLIFALRCRNYLPALISTIGFGVALPLCLWFAFSGLLWMATGRGHPAFAVRLDLALHNSWWPVLAALIFYHVIVTITAYCATRSILRTRQFTFNSPSRF